MQGERLSVSCAELRTAVSKARRANRGQETMGFATPNGLLPLRALAGTAKKRKLEAEASESQKATHRSVYDNRFEASAS